MISSLINKQDNSEIIRDKLAQILADESASQQALAVIAGEDPNEWRLRVYTERSNPWQPFINAPVSDRTPIVNVWFDNSRVLEGSSNVVSCQNFEGFYNVDIYGYGENDETNDGHMPNDEQAARESQRAMRLVRNILMAAEYTYLDIRGTVGRRAVDSITIFQPQLDNNTVQQITGARLVLRVRYNELSPQIEGETLEAIAIEIKRASDGRVLAEAEYNYL